VEPLIAGDPTQIGEYAVRARSWTSGSLTAYIADIGNRSVILLGVKNGSFVHDSDDHSIRIRALADSLGAVSAELGASIIDGGSSNGISYLVYEVPEGTRLRELIHQGKYLDPMTVTGLQIYFDRLLPELPEEQRILITPDTIFVNRESEAIVGVGPFELLELSASLGSSFGVNSLEWFAPETLAEGVRTNMSAKFSMAACLFAGAAGSPWSSPIRSLGELFTRSLNIERLQCNPELSELVTWLKTVPELRVANSPEVNDDPEFATEVGITGVNSFAKADSDKRPPFVLIGIVGVSLLAAVIAIGVNALNGNSVSETASTEVQVDGNKDDSPDLGASSEPEPTLEPDPVYQIRLDYASDAIPNQLPTNGIDFTFDVCSEDADWMTTKFQKGVKLQLKRGTSWVDVIASPKVIKGGRCESNQYNMTVISPVDPPDNLTANGIWSTCLSYRVTLPESSSFKKISVPFCAFVRQTA